MICFWPCVHWFVIFWEIVTNNFDIFKGLYLSYILLSRFLIILLYASGNFDHMCIIILLSYKCMLNCFRSHLITLILLIKYLGYLVTSYSSLFADFFHSIFLETPVVGSNLLESFYRAILESTYYVCFVFDSSTIWKHTVSYWDSISFCKLFC